jgi:hypothetical protein
MSRIQEAVIISMKITFVIIIAFVCSMHSLQGLLHFWSSHVEDTFTCVT